MYRAFAAELVLEDGGDFDKRKKSIGACIKGMWSGLGGSLWRREDIEGAWDEKYRRWSAEGEGVKGLEDDALSNLDLDSEGQR